MPRWKKSMTPAARSTASSPTKAVVREPAQPAYRYDVEVLHLLVSPAHAYFGRAREGAADVPTTDAEQVELVAGKGIVGDRFFGKAAHMDAAVTAVRGRGPRSHRRGAGNGTL